MPKPLPKIYTTALCSTCGQDTRQEVIKSVQYGNAFAQCQDCGYRRIINWVPAGQS